MGKFIKIRSKLTDSDIIDIVELLKSLEQDGEFLILVLQSKRHRLCGGRVQLVNRITLDCVN